MQRSPRSLCGLPGLSPAEATMTSGYLSKDRERINQLQRERRSTCRRIDYYASPEAQAAIEARRAREHPGGVHATNSAVLDAIVFEWAQLTGINNQRKSEAMTSEGDAGIIRHIRACANESGSEPELFHPSQARTCTNDSGGRTLAASRVLPVTDEASQGRARVVCGARRHRDGQPCQALSQPGKRRCKWHGGCSTGPRTLEGKAKARANLRRVRGAQ